MLLAWSGSPSGRLDPEAVDIRQVGRKAGQRLLAAAAHPQEQRVAPRLAQDAAQGRDVFSKVLEEHCRQGAVSQAKAASAPRCRQLQVRTRVALGMQQGLTQAESGVVLGIEVVQADCQLGRQPLRVHLHLHMTSLIVQPAGASSDMLGKAHLPGSQMAHVGLEPWAH